MPSKAAPNAFFMFMQEQQKKFKETTGRVYSMSELPGMCKDAWKRISPEERSHYDALAKREKQKRNLGTKGYAKLDSKRQVIADRKDPVKEDKKRREQEVRQMLSSWAGRDVRDIAFYVIDFQVMYDDLMDNLHLPMEIGIVSFTLRQGITNFLHQFTNPGDPPTGNRRIAQEHSELTHQIPINFDEADSNFSRLCDQMRAFLIHDPESNDVPPVYCLSVHRQQVENCLDFIYHRADAMPFINKIYCLEDLISTLITNTGRQDGVSQTQVYDVLIQNRWDYVSNIRCSYHNECDCSFCSLSIARRYSFAIFDILAILLDFKLTPSHVPDDSDQGFTVTEVGGLDQEQETGPQKWRHRDARERGGAKASKQPKALQAAGRGRSQGQGQGQGASWQPPTQEVMEIRLSDDDSDDDGRKPHDDDDDDDVEKDDDSDTEIQVPQQYTLKKLRKPKSSALVQSVPDPSQLQAEESADTAAIPQGYAAAASPFVRPLNPQMSGVRPMTHMMNPRFMAPPPGFRGRPLGPQPVTPAPSTAWPALSHQAPGANISLAMGAAGPRPLGRGLSSARGRGYAARQ